VYIEVNFVTPQPNSKSRSSEFWCRVVVQ